MDAILIKSTNWVGDAVMQTPTLRALRRAAPKARLTLLARPWVAALFEAHPDVDDLIIEPASDDRAGWRETMRRLRGTRWDLGLALPNSLSAAWTLFRAGAKRRRGYARDARRLLLNDSVRLEPWLRHVHEIDYYLHLVKDFADLPESERQPHAPPSDRARAETEALIQDGLRMAGFAGSPPPLLGIGGAAAFGTAKRWLPERFADCARALRERHGLLPVLIGSQAEAEVSAEIAKQIGPPFIDLAGKGDIAALAAVLGMLRLFLTNDTGPMHLAAAQGTQVVAVFGSTNWKTTAPRGPRTRLVRIPTTCAPCLRRHCPIDHRCMTAVEVEPVLLAAEELLATE